MGGPDEPVRRPRPRASWQLIAVAAAVAAVLVGGAVVLHGVGGNGSSTSTEAEIGRPADQAPAGFRWQYYRDVEVAVPSSWRQPQGWIYPRRPCMTRDGGDPSPPKPYVEQDAPLSPTTGDACRKAPHPLRTWADHVLLSSRHTIDHRSVRHIGPWTVVQRPLGHAVVTAVTRSPALADRIIGTARVIRQTPGGCDAADPIQARRFQQPPDPFDLAAVHHVDSITVCQYSFTTPLPQPGLLDELALSGTAATRALAALQAAPLGGGPDFPHDCMLGDIGHDAIVLRLFTGSDVDTMYMYYDSCRDNGFRDGTTARRLTRTACRTLIFPPVGIFQGERTAPCVLFR